MFIILPFLFLLLTALALFILRQVRPGFRFFWLIATGGTLAATISVFLWRFQLPIMFAPLSMELDTPMIFTLAWLVDGLSWPYALALITLATAVIITSVVREGRDPLAWGGILLLTAFGLLAVTSNNAFSILLAWAALDFSELIVGLISVGGEKSESVVIAYASRMAGIGLVIWAIVTAPGSLMDIRQIPQQAGLFLLLAVGIRMGVLPLHLPYQEAGLRRGFGSTLRLVSAASSLVLLGHLPANLMGSTPTSILLIMTALAALYAGWMWVRSAEELTGRPFWLLGMGSLSIGAALSGNPVGSIAWGIALVMGGSLLFLYSARQKSLLWLPLIAFFATTALPFSLTAPGWDGTQSTFWLYWLTHLPGQALLMAGVIKHSLHPGESAFESLPRWAKGIYPLGLGLLALFMLLLGIWGWAGSATIGRWWASLPGVALSIGIAWLVIKRGGRYTLQPASRPTTWLNLFRLAWLYRWLWSLYRLLARIGNTLAAQLEGESGILWSLVILVLLVSLIVQAG